jgi:hypothetical protein
VTLKLARAYNSLANARGGFSATVNLSFAALGHATLHDGVAVTFVRPTPRRPAKRSRKTKRSRARKA